MKLTELLARFKKGISLAISLVIIEHVAWIVEPAVFGKVIDALTASIASCGSGLCSALATVVNDWAARTPPSINAPYVRSI